MFKMAKNYSPKANMLLVSNDAKKLRYILTKFQPNIGLSMVDYGRCFEIDRFYINCQQYRDAYKDHTGRLPAVDGFEILPKPFASRPDPTSIYVKQPIKYMIERRPVVYPLTTERRGRPRNDTSVEIKLGGKYDQKPCLKYKR